MIGKNILVFGGSGQIGRHLIRRLTKNNHRVTAVTRNLHQKGYVLKTQGNPGYLEVVQSNIFDQESLRNLIQGKDICINLVGILFEKRNNTFKNIHVNFPSIVSKICNENNLDQFIHISALGIDQAEDSKYAKSKLDGEQNIKENFKKFTILRPSVVYSIDDNFTTNFMTMLNQLPFFPLYYNGRTKFTPIHVSEVSDIILHVIEKNIYSEIIECVGSEEYSFREILQKLLQLINKNKILVPLPLVIGKIMARILEIFPKPLLTLDQLKLLNYNNILSGKYKSNIDIGLRSHLKFEEEVAKYCYMWKDGGEYSK